MPHQYYRPFRNPNTMNFMRCVACMSALLVAVSSVSQCIEEIKPQYDGKLDSVDVLQNGSVQVSGSYEAVDLKEAAAQGMPDEELKDLLHWAIKHSDPKVLKEAAAGKVPQDAAERKKEVEEAIEHLRQEPGEAELMKEAMAIISSALSGEEARLQAFEALSYLLEPVDNANDLHKMGGIEVLQESLGGRNSRSLRAAAANAVAVAASNNAEFQERLWEKCGQDIVDKLLQVVELDDREAPAKGLYALSKLLANENFRRAFFEAGGLARLQGLLAGRSPPLNVRRKALTMLADLAHHKDTAEQILQLPERGRALARQIEEQLSAQDWDLSEKALLALKALAQMPGAQKLLQGADSTRRLQSFVKAVKAEAARPEKAEYIGDVLRLAQEVHSFLQGIHGGRSTDEMASEGSEGQKDEL